MNKYISKKESNIIGTIRGIAMIFIVICHYVSWFPQFSAAGQIFNVGVPIFFLISGYLYGQKNIGASYKRWFCKQFRKIVLPLYIYYAIVGSLLLLLGKLGDINLISFCKLMLNLQGIVGGSAGNITTGHLWFITYILICYLITPTLEQAKNAMSWKKLFFLLSMLSILEIAIILTITPHAFLVNIQGVILYVGAYYFAALWKKKIKPIHYVTLSFVMIIAVGIRLGIKLLADNSGGTWEVLYERVVVQYTQSVLAVWIIFTIVLMEMMRKNCGSLFNMFSRYSYEIYIVHYMFLTGVFNASKITDNFIVNTVIFVILAVSFAVVLHFLSSKITDKFFMRNRIAMEGEA